MKFGRLNKVEHGERHNETPLGWCWSRKLKKGGCPRDHRQRKPNYKATAEMNTTRGAGQPAFSIGSIDRIDAISRSSVITLAMNPVGLQYLWRDAIAEREIDEIKDVLTSPNAIKMI